MKYILLAEGFDAVSFTIFFLVVSNTFTDSGGGFKHLNKNRKNRKDTYETKEKQEKSK